MRLRQLLHLTLALCLLTVTAGTAPPAFAACPERPKCEGCGCAGGPGYRGPNGKCVGFKRLDEVCGTPPTLRCDFENAPGTGRNRDCALGTDNDNTALKGDD